MALTDLINQYSVSNSTTAATTATTETAADLKNQFLQLLVTQLQNQDPLDPVKNEDFVAQLAQFNSLEQMINLNESFTSMMQAQQLSQAASFVGQPVAYLDAEGTPVSGIALTVSVDDGTPYLQVGTDYVTLDQLIGFGQSSAGSLLQQSSYLIDKMVAWDNEDGSTGSGVVSSVEIESGTVKLVVDGDTDNLIDLTQIYSVGTVSE